MRFPGTPLAALSASFLTWYALEQKNIHMSLPSSGGVVQDGHGADGATCSCDDQLREKDRQIAHLRAAASAAASGAPVDSARDEFREFLLSGQRSMGVLQDVATFTWVSISTQIWTWPAEKDATFLPDLQPHVELVRKATSEHLGPVLEKARSTVQDVHAQIPPEVSKSMLDASTSVTAVVQSGVDKVNAAFEVARDSFLENHPEHRASFAGLHPVLLVLLVVAVVYQVFEFTRLGLMLSMALLNVPLKVMCFLCCCCRRKKAADTSKAPSSGKVAEAKVADAVEAKAEEPPKSKSKASNKKR